MAVEFKLEKNTEQQRSYPYLGKAKNGQIVFFGSEKKGMNLNGIGCQIGHITDVWNEGAFTPLPPSESITLRNV